MYAKDFPTSTLNHIKEKANAYCLNDDSDENKGTLNETEKWFFFALVKAGFSGPAIKNLSIKSLGLFTSNESSCFCIDSLINSLHFSSPDAALLYAPLNGGKNLNAGNVPNGFPRISPPIRR